MLQFNWSVDVLDTMSNSGGGYNISICIFNTEILL